MADYSITADARSVIGKKVNTLRNDGQIPGTIYGPKTAPITVQFGYKELEKTLRLAGSTNIIDVKVQGESIRVVARDVQRHVLKGTILHVDFFAVDEDSKIRAEVPVMLRGESPIIASRKAILMAGTSSVRIEVFPRDLINKIEIDLSALTEIGSTIYVKDLKVGEGITILNDGEEMIAKALQTGGQRATADLELGD